MSTVRSPAVAGSFYEADPARLAAQLQACYSRVDASRDDPSGAGHSPARRDFIGAVSPHAGLMYSGHVAAALFAQLTLPARYIILCPNHTGAGHPAALFDRGAWAMPFGPVPVDEELAVELLAECDLFAPDVRAHAREHSLEVQLPFLQHERRDFRFVPICLAIDDVGQCERVGQAIAGVIRNHEPGTIGLIASSDLNHYESLTITLRKDQRAIDSVLALDPRTLWKVVRDEDISMCGIIPTTAMLFAANALGASEATLVRHATSGDINGDYNAVVGYASIIIR